MKTGDKSEMFRLVPVSENKPKHLTFVCQYTSLKNVNVCIAIVILSDGLILGERYVIQYIEVVIDSRGSRGGPPPPLFLDQTKAQRV